MICISFSKLTILYMMEEYFTLSLVKLLTLEVRYNYTFPYEIVRSLVFLFS